MPKGKKPGFACMDNKGFHITFENGYTVSVQFGTGNYCDKQSYGPGSLDAPMRAENGLWESPNAEIAVWDEAGDWTIESQVDGYITPNSLLQVLDWAAGGCKGEYPLKQDSE